MILLEKIASTLALLAIILNLFLIPGTGMVVVLSLTLLTGIYFHFGFAFFNGVRLRHIFKKESWVGKSTMRIFGAIASGISLSVAVIGILFKVMIWPGSSMMLLDAIVLIPIVLLVGFIKNDKSEYYTRIIKRLMIYGVLVSVLFLIPTSAHIDFKYRNYPDYIKAFKDARANPHNLELRQKLDEESIKMRENK